MRNMFIVALVAFGLLLLGCTASSQYEVGGSEEASASGSASSGSPQPPAAQESPADTAPVSGQPTAPPLAPDADLSGKIYSELLMLGKASVCDVALHSYEGERALRIYFDGNGNMRSEEAATGNAYCPTNVMIYKGDLATGGMLYTTCPGHTDVLGSEFGTHTPCDWQSMEISAEWGGIGSASRGLSMPDDSQLDTPVLEQPADYSCSAWTVDASKFEVPGYACD